MADLPANDVLAALEPVVDAFDALGVRYRIGGSVASSALGVPRSTLDVDVACELRLPHVAPFAARLASGLDVPHLKRRGPDYQKGQIIAGQNADGRGHH